VTLAGAFAEAVESCCGMLEAHFLVEQKRLQQEDAQAKQQEACEEQKEKSKKERWAEQLAWERERYEKEEKKELLIQLMKEGKTAAKAKKFMTTAAKEAKEEKICQEKKSSLFSLRRKV
jgi:hypothetical protein